MSSTDCQTDYPGQDVRRAARRTTLPPAPTVPSLTAQPPSATPPTQTRRSGAMPPPAAPREPPPAQKQQLVIASDAGLQAPSPIIPAGSVAGRALLAIIAIMSFLAAATVGAVVLVRQAAGEWQGQVSREFTIQVRPVQGRDIEADVGRAAALARAAPGVATVRIFTREESAQLLEPWLGAGLSLEELPVPRLIVVTQAANAQPDPDQLRRRLSSDLPNATLDDHRAWMERMRSATQAAVAGGFGILALMLFATVLLVTFATRAAMTANKAIVEVLHFVGAKNRYIARQFQRHFLAVGMKGAALGGGTAAMLFLAAWLAQTRGTTLDAQTAALLGALNLGPEGYAGMFGVLVLIGAVTALTSRWTVHRTLNTLE